MTRLLPDLRYSVRTLVKRPAFTLGAAGALALGIGLTTAVFSVTDAVLLRPLPYAGVNRLVTLQQTNPDNPDDVRISPATYLDWRDASHAFAATAAVRPWSYTFAATDDPVILAGRPRFRRLLRAPRRPADARTNLRPGGLPPWRRTCCRRQPSALASSIRCRSLDRRTTAAIRRRGCDHDRRRDGAGLPMAGQDAAPVGALPDGLSRFASNARRRSSAPSPACGMTAGLDTARVRKPPFCAASSRTSIPQFYQRHRSAGDADCRRRSSGGSEDRS